MHTSVAPGARRVTCKPGPRPLTTPRSAGCSREAGLPSSSCTASRLPSAVAARRAAAARAAGARVRDDRVRREHPGGRGTRHLGQRAGQPADRAPRPRAGDPRRARPRRRRAHRGGPPAGPVRRAHDHERDRLRLLAHPVGQGNARGRAAAVPPAGLRTPACLGDAARPRARRRLRREGVAGDPLPRLRRAQRRRRWHAR